MVQHKIFKKELKMNRREFLVAGLATAMGASLYANIQEKPHPPYFDGLSFLSPDMEDVKRSGLCGFVWDVAKGELINGQYRRTLIPSLKSFAKACSFLRDNKHGLFLATKGSQIEEAYKTGKTGVILQFQSLLPLAEDLGLMDAFFDLGLRILQITHHYENPFGGGCLVPSDKWTGLTKLGCAAVEKMNSLGIIPDVSHGNEKLGPHVTKISKKPVIVSHTGCRALVNNARCIPDSVIKAVADSGGVVGIFSMSFWLTTEKKPTMDSYIRQLEHVINVGGIDAVGVSNDFTIAGELNAKAKNNKNELVSKLYHPWWKQHKGVLGFDLLPQHAIIPELNHVKRFFSIQTALEKRGFSEEDIAKILGGNWIRVLNELP